MAQTNGTGMTDGQATNGTKSGSRNIRIGNVSGATGTSYRLPLILIR